MSVYMISIFARIVTKVTFDVIYNFFIDFTMKVVSMRIQNRSYLPYTMICTTLHHPFKRPLVFDLWSFFSIPPFFDITMFNPRENDLQVYVHLPALEQEEFRC